MVLPRRLATLTGVRCAATTGLVLLSPFRGKGASNDGYLGLGFLWQQGAKKNGPYVNRNEYGIELTYVAQVTPTMTLQPDIQLVKNPVKGPDGGGFPDPERLVLVKALPENWKILIAFPGNPV